MNLKDLKVHFDDFGIEVTDGALQKSLEICLLYKIEDASQFVDKWFAYSLSNLDGEPPNIENLIEFERKVLKKEREKYNKINYNNLRKNTTTYNQNSISEYMDSLLPSRIENPLALYGITDEMVAEYEQQESISKLNTCNIFQSPVANKHDKPGTSASCKLGLFSPRVGNNSPTATALLADKSSGKVMFTFGHSKIINGMKWSEQKSIPKIVMKQLLTYKGCTLTCKAKYMFDKLNEKAELLEEHLLKIGQLLCNAAFGDEQNFRLHGINQRAHEPVKILGMVYAEHDGQLGRITTHLMGLDTNTCHTVQLNFSKLQSFGIFSGQVVMLSGINPNGEVFIADQLYTETNIKPPAAVHLKEPLKFAIAAGPFTNDDDVIYEPLNDLLTCLKAEPPNVLILIGPFISSNHKLIKEGCILGDNCDMFFEIILYKIMEIMGNDFTVVIIVSHNDINTEPVYPTMPFNIKKKYRNVRILPDPSLLDFNTLRIAVTSTDVVNHILKSEWAINAGETFKRVVNYLFQQKCFYPLRPPMVDDDICVDSNLLHKYANLEEIPNIFLLPSDEKCFIRVVKGCVAINPGRVVSKNMGSFARLTVMPNAPDADYNPFNYIGCEIRKL